MPPTSPVPQPVNQALTPAQAAQAVKSALAGEAGRLEVTAANVRQQTAQALATLVAKVGYAKLAAELDEATRAILAQRLGIPTEPATAE